MELALAVLLSLGFAAACHVLARRRHRNVPLWSLLGFLFGPIALIVLLLLGRK